VVKTTDYIVSRDNYRATADVRREFFGDPFPAATGAIVKEQFGRGVLIEIDAVAVIGTGLDDDPSRGERA
jgi:enamine deaminase RidA (YjgF/YER057c/UK114 family)